MQRKNIVFGILSCIVMMIIILDGKAAVSSAQSGIDLCVRTVIPSLLPFFVLSGIMNSCFLGQKFRFLTPLRMLCRIPVGSESILLIGLISGYPVGAQLITDAYNSGNLSKKDAMRMLGFCSNAGPAFIFGMLSTVFNNTIIPWVLWGIHIVSALAVGWVFPGSSTNKCLLRKKENVSVTIALHNAIRNVATVCGWVILFRLLLDFCNRWFLWLLPIDVQVLISGCVELTNGCLMLHEIESECIQFVLSSAMLAFGGLCVAMQTVSVTKSLSISFYFPGKLLQMLFSVTLSAMLSPLLFCGDYCLSRACIIVLAASVLLSIYLVQRKK